MTTSPADESPPSPLQGNETIPVVDFRDWLAGGERAEGFTAVLGQALEDLGFVGVAEHGFDPLWMQESYAVARRTFGLPEETKRRYEDPASGRERGYTSFGVEHARDSDHPDLKEFWHVGRSVELDQDAMARTGLFANRFPVEAPEFGERFSVLFSRLEAFALQLLDAVGRHLELPPSYFRDMVREGNSVLRVIHYPDLAGSLPPGAVRAAAHEDINLMTVLPASTHPGLELLTRDGDWMPVHTRPGVMICDTGDMMQLVTAGRLRSTTHRVVNPPGPSDGGRLSMPFFVHPRRDCLLTPLVEGYAEPVLADAFLYERLKETGVARAVKAPSAGEASSPTFHRA